ncbi:TPA: hypothetical protein ACH3X3_005124 [Trebouxia sp. C0006]
MQQIVCGLGFEDVLNNAHTGTAGKLKLQLVDTAANTGAGQPNAHASVDLDMRQWKDSQTYQAEVPWANDQVHALHQSLLDRQK